MKSKISIVSAAAIALLLLAACGSSNPLGDIYGNGGNNGNYSTQIRGTVDSVDLNSNSIYLINATSSNGSMLSNSGGTYGNSVRIYFDNRTSVDYQGRNYSPADLERGDQVSVNVDQTSNSNRLYATTMSVLSDVRNSGQYPSGATYPNGSSNPNGGYNSVIHGTVRSIDTNRRTISIDTGYNAYTTILYSSNTPVYYSGRNYSPSDLEVGDQIDVRVGNSSGSNQYQAQDITVTRSISDNGTTNGTYGQASTIRGTVTYVDTSRHTIELQGVNYTGFNRNTTNGGTIVISYDNATNVDVRGQSYPVSGLERGDVVDVQVANSGYNSSTYLAQRIILVRDVRQ